VAVTETLVRPLFISGRSSLTTLPVFIGLTGGVSAFGAVALFLGPVFVALILALIELIEEWRRAPEIQVTRPAASD
jgi:Ca2+-transporting ATPase